MTDIEVFFFPLAENPHMVEMVLLGKSNSLDFVWASDVPICRHEKPSKALRWGAVSVNKTVT